MNASAVLIYPDPADYQLSDNAPLFGHVSPENTDFPSKRGKKGFLGGTAYFSSLIVLDALRVE